MSFGSSARQSLPGHEAKDAIQYADCNEPLHATHELELRSRNRHVTVSSIRMPGVCLLHYAAAPAMIDALWPPKPKLLLITARSLRSRGVFGV